MPDQDGTDSTDATRAPEPVAPEPDTVQPDTTSEPDAVGPAALSEPAAVEPAAPDTADQPAEPVPDEPVPDEPVPDEPVPDGPDQATGQPDEAAGLVTDPPPDDGARQPFVPRGGERRFTPAAPSGTRRLWNAVTQRPDGGQVLVAVLVALLGFGAALQVRADEDDTLANARRDDLVQILDGLRRQADRLDDHVGELEADRRDLISGADTEAAALEQAQERARVTGVLAGTLPATGPGIIMTITDPDHRVNSALMLQAINELRVAGAEAIQIRGGGNDTAVRVVADTAFENPQTDVLRVGGVDMEPPYEVVAIGDPRELSGAMTFAEGIVSRIEGQGAEASVNEYDELVVDVLHEPQPPQYAHPAPEDEDDE